MGGTGILVFMDFLSRLAMYLCDVHMNDEKFYFFGKHFRLKLYYAIEREEVAIGLEMLKLMRQVCHRFRLKNF